MIVAIGQQGFDSQTRDQIMALLPRPRSPAESRRMAIHALEFRRKGLKWPEIEKQLLPQRKYAQNPGQTIRREVQFLNRTLKRHGVSLEST